MMPGIADLVASLERVMRVTAITGHQSTDATLKANLRSALAAEVPHMATPHRLGGHEALQDKTLGEIAFLLIVLAPERRHPHVMDHITRLREHAEALLAALAGRNAPMKAIRRDSCANALLSFRSGKVEYRPRKTVTP
jgi:hypothetical protein